MNIEIDGITKYSNELRKFKESRIFLSKKNLEVSAKSSDDNILRIVSISKNIPPLVEPKTFELDKKLSDFSSKILNTSKEVYTNIVNLEKFIDKSGTKDDTVEAFLSSLDNNLKYEHTVLDNYMKDGGRIASQAQELNKSLEGYARDVSESYEKFANTKSQENRDKIEEIAALIIDRNNACLGLFNKIISNPTILNETPFSIKDIIEHKRLVGKNIVVSETIVIGIITIIVTIIVPAIFYTINEFQVYKKSVENIADKEKFLLSDNSDLFVAYKICNSINDLSKASQKIHDDYIGVVNRLLIDNVNTTILINRMSKIPKGAKISDKDRELLKEHRETAEKNRAFLTLVGDIVNSQEEEKK